jgi:SPX domain protein involved in polyphosphate accumulation
MNIELNKVYTFKLTNADEVVAKVIEDNTSTIVVTQPLSAIPSEKGIQLIFTVFTGDPKENITINKSAIVMICQTREEVGDHYLEATTGIKPVRNSKILMG